MKHIAEVWANAALSALRDVDEKLAEIERVSPDGGHTAIYAEEAREIIAQVLSVRPLPHEEAT